MLQFPDSSIGIYVVYGAKFVDGGLESPGERLPRSDVCLDKKYVFAEGFQNLLRRGTKVDNNDPFGTLELKQTDSRQAYSRRATCNKESNISQDIMLSFAFCNNLPVIRMALSRESGIASVVIGIKAPGFCFSTADGDIWEFSLGFQSCLGSISLSSLLVTRDNRDIFGFSWCI
jgi:hypothetical protein